MKSYLQSYLKATECINICLHYWILSTTTFYGIMALSYSNTECDILIIFISRFLYKARILQIYQLTIFNFEKYKFVIVVVIRRTKLKIACMRKDI